MKKYKLTLLNKAIFDMGLNKAIFDMGLNKNQQKAYEEIKDKLEAGLITKEGEYYFKW